MSYTESRPKLWSEFQDSRMSGLSRLFVLRNDRATYGRIGYSVGGCLLCCPIDPISLLVNSASIFIIIGGVLCWWFSVKFALCAVARYRYTRLARPLISKQV